MNRRPRQMGVCRSFANEGFLALGRHPESKITVGACLSISYVGFNLKTLLVAVRLCRTFTLISPHRRHKNPASAAEMGAKPMSQAEHIPPVFLNTPSTLRGLNADALQEGSNGHAVQRIGSNRWQMGVMVGGRQLCRSAHTTNKNLAKKILMRWETEVFERRFHLPQSVTPYFKDWADDFVAKVSHPNTQKRYACSVKKLKDKFTGLRVLDISADRIEEYTENRLAEGVKDATINHDLRVLRRMLRLAERKQLITRNPFLQVEFLKQPSPHPPHIVSFEDEEKILDVAPPHIHVLVVLILETGMRSRKEALSLRWDAIDFTNNSIRVRESKTRAGVRDIPLTGRCKAELIRWREKLGHGFSPFVFPNMRKPDQHMKDIAMLGQPR